MNNEKKKLNKEKNVYFILKSKNNYFFIILVDVQQFERAAAIAEKYLDFDILVQICELTQSGDRMQRYMMQFANQVLIFSFTKSIYLSILYIYMYIAHVYLNFLFIYLFILNLFFRNFPSLSSNGT